MGARAPGDAGRHSGLCLGRTLLRRRHPGHGTGHGNGSGGVVSRFGRRTFLASTAGGATGAVVADVGAPLPLTGGDVSGAAERAAEGADATAGRPAPLRPVGLTVN